VIGRRRSFGAFVIAAAIGWVTALGADTYNQAPAITEGIGVEQRLGVRVPLNLKLVDEKNESVTLKSYLGSKPALLVPIYFGCPNLCSLTMKSLIKGLGEMSLRAGKDFSVILYSIDPKDSSETAREKKKRFLHELPHLSDNEGFHFLTASQANSEALSQAIGFKYHYDEPSHQYVHASAVMVLTSEGDLSRYLYGLDFPGRDLKLALIEASRMKIGSPLDKFLLYCYHFDPVQGRYGLMITRILRILSVLTVVGLGVAIGGMILWERKRLRALRVEYR
jgi:protein SCO1